ncbi:MAG TPA: hypothetical protein VK540_14740 [Polyangiaceae bacterium]|nr:hypothetical protein [Polyangiaceae bacterium]
MKSKPFALHVRPRWAPSLVISLLAGLPACSPGAHSLAARPPAPPSSAPPVETSDLPPSPTSAKTDELVARHIAARGGLEKLRALKSLRLTGTTRFGDDELEIEASYGVVQKRPGSIRVEITFQGLTGVDACEGSEVWSTEPWSGRRDPFRQSVDESKELVHLADLDGPLVDWRAKGHRVDYLGLDEVDGAAAHKLRVTLKDRDVEYHYLDQDSLLAIRIVYEQRIRGVERLLESDLGDYEQVAGVWMPFSIDSGKKGAPRNAHLTIERAQPNVEIDDAVFRFPASGSSVQRAIAAPEGPSPPSTPPPASKVGDARLDPGVISGLGARNIGSAAMSGRVAAVAAFVDSGKTTVYVGAASGGVWKSLDGATTFRPIFDKESVQSIGAIAIDPSRHDTVWVGSGESWTRNSVSIGDGIYKSTDGGSSWQNMGLAESERIARILVHPQKSDVVYACVPGKLWSDSADRGVYKTVDGGKTWALVLKGPNLSTGCAGLTMDPKDPEVLLAGMWDFRRRGWTSRSGGDGPTAPSGSSLQRTGDGGKTWSALTKDTNQGLPAGPWGRVEVAFAPSDAKVVYAFIESVNSALFASSDGGKTWQERDKSRNVVWRPFYFARLVVDPLQPNRVFKPDATLIVSEDGGKSFARAGGKSHGDWHDLWIDPTNTQHIIGGDDGGLWISWDGGNRWWKSNNLPISQFYHVSVDAKDPYQVYGGLQDNSSWVGDSAYPGGISNSRWENLFNSDGFWVIPDPTDPQSVYAEAQGGYVSRIDRRTRAARDIQPKARYQEKLRFNWNAPIHASPTQKGTIYLGAQFLFRSRDRGDSWERISPDLSTNDPEKQKQEQSGGVTVDNSSAEMHTTIYSISESPKDNKTIWVGTDDGNLQLTRDAGKSWTNVIANVPGLPKASWVSWVEASRHDAATAYACFDRHTFGDMTPWVFKTSDYGKSWTRIAGSDKGVRGYAHVVKEDVIKPDLLFVGTEFGLFVSLDGGAGWAEFKGGDFPRVAVRDLQLQTREDDLVIATHGRGIWIIDDIAPLRALGPKTLGQRATFLPGRPVQQRMRGMEGWVEGDAAYMGRNPPDGAVITYYQRERHLYGRLKLEVLDAGGRVVDTLNATKRRGINRVTWSMQMKPARVPRAAQVAYNATQGPRVLPGIYTVRLTKGADIVESKLKIDLDRRAPFTLAERKQQFEAAGRIQATFSEMTALTDRIDAARAACDARLKALPAGDALVARLKDLLGKLQDTKQKVVATKEGGAITGEERIREHLDLLYGAVNGWEGRPARYQLDRIEVLRRELGEVQKAFETLALDIRSLDGPLREKKLEPISTSVQAPAVP